MNLGTTWRIGLAFGLACSIVLLTACDKLPGRPAGVVVVDLDAVAKATGEDVAMDRRLESESNQLNAQLSEMVGNLETQLSAEREKLGDSATEAQQQEYQQLASQAQQQYAQSQTSAQQRVQQLRVNLIAEFRQKVQPIAAEIALSRGATIVTITNAGLLWFDNSVDITDEVLAGMRALPPEPTDFGGDPATITPEPAIPATGSN